MIGMYRDHDTLQPVDYYLKLPKTWIKAGVSGRSDAGDGRQRIRCAEKLRNTALKPSQ